MNFPKISIITIVFNGEKEIEKTLQSVIAQKKHVSFEYIVVDGKSTDRTAEIIQHYISDIDVYVSESDRGISDAFNKGVKLANGSWVNFLNAGDTFASDQTLLEVSLFLDTKYDIVYGDMNFVDEEGIILRRMTKKNVNVPFYRMFRVLHQSTFHNKSYFDEYGLFDIEFKRVMDLELLLRKRELKYLHVDRVFSNLEIGGISQTNIVDVYEEIRQAYLKNTSYMPFDLFVNKWRSICFHYLHKIKSQFI